MGLEFNNHTPLIEHIQAKMLYVDKVCPLISDRSCMPIILKDPNKIINICIYMVFKKYKSKNIDHRNFQ